MGNCQASDAAMVVIQHPSGKVQRLYWPISAREVMRSNPGHYIALVTNTYQPSVEHNHGSIHFTQLKLLRAKDTLIIGQVYRLVTSQEVMDALWAKNCTRMKKKQLDLERKERRASETQRLQEGGVDRRKTEPGNLIQEVKQERNRHDAAESSARVQWRPSLQSISESGSGS